MTGSYYADDGVINGGSSPSRLSNVMMEGEICGNCDAEEVSRFAEI